MKKDLNLLIPVFAILFAAACSKDKKDDNNVTPAPKTKTELITGKWITTAYTETYVENGQTITDDEFAGGDACDKDDLDIYSADGTIKFDEGATKCDPTDPQVFGEGKWTFIENETKIVFTEDGYSDTADITELTEATLKLTYHYEYDTTMVTGEHIYKKVE